MDQSHVMEAGADEPLTRKPMVVFVDDEENILHGIKRLLRSRRDVWTMEFVTSGAAALELLDRNQVDVVVSDMRMPHMDGAEFLAKVRQRHPDVVRLVLSGYAEREAVLRTIGPSHRYLAKPCTEEVLVGAIEGALRLRVLLGSDRIKSTVAGLSHLPSLPKTYGAILAELSSEYASADSLAAIVERDIAISAQLLKLTNSAYFGLPQKIVTVKQAIQFLGFDNVRGVVLLAGVFEQFRGISPAMSQVVERLSSHSLGIAVLARAMARADHAPPGQVDEAFCAGLLAHVGTLLLIANSAGQFNAAMARLDRGEASVEEAEHDAFGASHAELGAYLLNLWGFNDSIVEAVAHHHQPGTSGDHRNAVLTFVHAAQYLLRDMNSDRAAALRAREPLDADYMERAGQAGKLPAWRTICRTYLKEWTDGEPHSVH